MTATRRQMLTGMGAGAIGLLAAQTCTSGGRSGKMAGDHYDVVVIGAGFAGLVAARDCAQMGHRVLLLEAKDRIGGRTYDARVDGEHIEFGGTWIHWAQGYVWREFSRYGLTIKESLNPIPGKASWIAAGNLHEGDAVDFFGKMAQGIRAFSNVDGSDGRTIFPRPYNPFFNGEVVRRLDRLSLSDRLEALSVPPEIRDITAGLMAMGAGNTLDQGALLDWLKWWSLNDYDFGILAERQARYKIEEGTGALAKAILADASVHLKLSSPVTSVEQSGTGVIVSTPDAAFRARAVVVAVPLAVLHSIRFKPQLSSIKISVSQTGNCTAGRKVCFKLQESVGAWTGVSPPPNPISYALSDGDGSLIVAFCLPGDIDFADRSEAQKALRTLLPKANVVATWCHDWTEDPYARAEWCWYRPGVLIGAFNELRRPEGRVHMAGGDIADGWRGFIDGAIESGTMVSRAVHQQLTGLES